MAFLKQRLGTRFILTLVIYLIPIVGTFWFVNQFAVDIPLFDQWNLPIVFDKFARNSLGFQHLFSLHNTHRLFFPKIIFTLLAFSSSWNIWLELYFSLGLASLTFLILYQVSRATISEFTTSNAHQGLIFHGINLLSCLLCFSWAQYENWLWGFQIAIFLINFCLVSSCWILVSSQLRNKAKLFLSGLLCLIASLCSIQGLLTWLALIPTVLSLKFTSHRVRCFSLMGWLATFTVLSYIYSVGYQPEPYLDDSAQGSPATLLQFFLNLLAAPILGNYQWNWIFGGILLFSFIGLVAFSWLAADQERLAVKSITPWVSLGCFSILYGCMTSIGRFGFGADYAIQASRYTTHSFLLPVAIVQLFLVFSYGIADINRNHPQLSGMNGFILGVLYFMVVARSLNTLDFVTNSYHYQLTTGQTCLNLIHYLENSDFINDSQQSCLRRIHPQPRVIRAGVNLLERIDLRNFQREIQFIDNPDTDYGYVDSIQDQSILESVTVERQDLVKLKGWAILPNCRQPQQVFFTRVDQAQHPSKKFFANADVQLNSLDISQFLNLSCYSQSRWQLQLPAHFLSVGDTMIQAWVYDPMVSQFIRLRGNVKITVLGEPKPELS